jgi:DUF971 family protein
MSDSTIPLRLDLKKTERLEIQWQDGVVSNYPLALLRAKCPCAMCKTVRQEEAGKPRPLLQILPGNYSDPLSVVSAELVGNYALKIEWSDEHGTGIYSFQYLRTLATAPMELGRR